MANRTPPLAEEARHLHACLFRKPLEAAVIVRYEAAHRALFADQPPSPLVATVVAKHLDAEAVEYALRRRGLGGELTRKMQMVCYLVEARRAYFSEFVAIESSRAGAWTALLAATCSSLWKLLKGEYLIHRHGLL